MKRLLTIGLCAILASVFIYPIFQGLILLPLDLLVSNSSPWHLAGTILLKNPYMQDSILQMFPWKHLTFASVTNGILPIWNPYQFMGMPFMAAMKPLVFYPANIFFIFGEATAWNILLWLQLFLSLVFMVLLVESFELGLWFGIFAGISFAFSSLMVTVLEFGSEGHVLLWLPLLLYLVKKYTDTKKPVYIALISLATACAIFAGQLQYFAYMAMVVVGFSWFYGKTLRPVIGLVLGGLISGIQLMPGIEMFTSSYRGLTDSYNVFAGGLLRPYHLLRYLSPDWFGNPVTGDLRGGYIEVAGYFGIIALFFALYAIVYHRKNRIVLFLSIVFILALLFSFEGLGQVFYILRIPVITGGYGGRLFSMTLFSGAALSAFGLHAFIKDSWARKIRALIAYAITAFLCFAGGLAWGGVALTNIKIQIVALTIFIVCAFIFARFGKSRLHTALFIFVVIGLSFMDLFRMGYRFLTFSNQKFLYPSTGVATFVRSRTAATLGREYGLTEPEVNTELGVYGTETYNPLLPLRTVKLLQALENKTGDERINNKYYLTRNPRMKYVLDVIGVTFIVVPKGQNPAITLWNSSSFEKDITKVYGDDGNDVFINTTAIPRFGLYWDSKPGTPDDRALTIMRNQSVDFSKTLLIREPLNEHITSGTGSAKLSHADVNSLSFAVTVSSPALFYLSDSYDPGWHASVNGREVPILHANYNFRAVVVPKGDSAVKFWYLPASVIIGAVVSVFGILGTAWFLIKR